MYRGSRAFPLGCRYHSFRNFSYRDNKWNANSVRTVNCTPYGVLAPTNSPSLVHVHHCHSQSLFPPCSSKRTGAIVTSQLASHTAAWCRRYNATLERRERPSTFAAVSFRLSYSGTVGWARGGKWLFQMHAEAEIVAEWRNQGVTIEGVSQVIWRCCYLLEHR